MDTAVRDAVFALIQGERHCKPHEIALDRSLNIDLGMDGDDAVEFFEKFGQKFSVDLTELGEEWDRYLGPEGFSLFGPPDGLLTLFTASAQPTKGKKIPLQICRLVDAAETGRWNKSASDTDA